VKSCCDWLEPLLAFEADDGMSLMEEALWREQWER
jgi:hypothetical protein